jgi:hypothetical protein
MVFIRDSTNAKSGRQLPKRQRRNELAAVAAYAKSRILAQANPEIDRKKQGTCAGGTAAMTMKLTRDIPGSKTASGQARRHERDTAEVVPTHSLGLTSLSDTFGSRPNHALPSFV